MSIDAVYNARILDLAGNIDGIGRLDAPDGTARRHSKLCGSTVTVDVRLGSDGRIVDFAQDVKACALGQASAAILAKGAVGASLDELREGRDGLRAVLKDGAQAPDGRFAELEFLSPVKDYRARHASTMLAFEAAVEAVEQALATEGQHGALKDGQAA